MSYRGFKNPVAFSLAEMLAALTIGSMVLVVVLGIYSHSERSADAIGRRLYSDRLPHEVLQRIAEDIDRIVTTDSNTRIMVENKFKEGLPAARLTITKMLYDRENKQQTFEQIVWQAAFDNEAFSDGLVLYRSHSGLALEDKLLDQQKEGWERELFVPICGGLTYFKVEVPVGDALQEKWTGESLPRGLVVTVSFAEPFKRLDNTLDVPSADKITRTISVDRTRKIKFNLAVGKEGNKD